MNGFESFDRENNPEYINSFNNRPEGVLEKIKERLYDFQSQE